LRPFGLDAGRQEGLMRNGHGMIGFMLAAASMLAFTGPAEASVTDRAMVRPPVAMTDEVQRPCDGATLSATDGATEHEPRQLIGEVLAIDARQGRLVLGTEYGTVALAAPADAMQELGVGDIIVVEFVQEADQRAGCV
jgi:hypothetical protein